MKGNLVFWQPTAGKLPVHIGEYRGDATFPMRHSLVRHAGRTIKVETRLLRSVR